jgi:peptidoglycan/xylan/chitin deacetylase (PgdA/CDA1 family)
MSGSETAILTYHSLDDSGSVISVSPETFRRQMTALAASGLPVIPLDRIRDEHRGVALTFDDAFVNFHQHAAPLLSQLRFPATVFVVTGHAGGWNDWSQSAGIPRLPLMDWPRLREIADAGMDIGAHSVSHPHLPELTRGQVEAELKACRDEIEHRLGRRVQNLAYPYGAENKVVRRVAAQYYRLACGVEMGFVRPDSLPMRLPRLDMYYLRDESRFGRFCRGQARVYLTTRRLMRELRALMMVRS